LKNMPSLVRAGLTALAPVDVSTVSERARRERARAISSAHSSAESSSAEDDDARGRSSPADDAHVAVAGGSPACRRCGGAGHRRARARSRRRQARPRWARIVVSSASIATLAPAARLHRVEDDVGRMAGRRLGDDPSSELGGDRLHAPILPDV
jgi:hypothetical protein